MLTGARRHRPTETSLERRRRQLPPVIRNRRQAPAIPVLRLEEEPATPTFGMRQERHQPLREIEARDFRNSPQHAGRVDEIEDAVGVTNYCRTNGIRHARQYVIGNKYLKGGIL